MAARRVLKCVALLGILKDARLPAKLEILQLALTGLSGAEVDVPAALEELKARRLIVFSRVRDTYRLWEGGDIDVEAEMSRARSTLGAGAVLRVARDPALCPPPRLIARRHSFETGTMRVVGSRICTASGLDATIREMGKELTLLLCLAETREELTQAEQRLRNMPVDSTHLLAAVALETEALRDAAEQIEASHYVEEHVAGLQGDRAARRELAARRAEAEAAFRGEWDRLFGPHQGSATFYYRGEPQTSIHNTRTFSEFLSRMADETYPYAPRLRNELVNRHSLSSAAAAGRRNLIEAMLISPTQARLDIKGYPPERSMYECVLLETGIHRPREAGDWEFTAPPEDHPAGLRSAWDEMERFIFSDPPEPRPLTALYDRLMAPPYGISLGVLPILFCALLLAHADEITLYREGTFLPEPGVADFELLVRRPDLFAVAGCRVTGDRSAVVQRIANALGTPSATVPVVRALLRMYKSLPDCARKTRRVPGHVLAFREALERSRSPEQMLFVDVPAALGLEPLGGSSIDASSVEHFFVMLNGAFRTLAEVSPDAIGRARDALLQASGMPLGQDGWRKLRDLAAQLDGCPVDPALRPIVHGAALPDDDDTALERVLSHLASRPPRTWTDADADRCVARAYSAGSQLLQAMAAMGISSVDRLDTEEQERSREITTYLRGLLPAGIPTRIMRAALLALVREMDGEGTSPDE